MSFGLGVPGCAFADPPPCPTHTPCAALALTRPAGQAAADKIFSSKQQKPLDKAKTAKGKATAKGKTTRR